ncbi:MAG: hypothetical protein IPL61_05350 [Myxococcales bacterium]|nr:hypothetical protein [Myxococcales bacterium]
MKLALISSTLLTLAACGGGARSTAVANTGGATAPAGLRAIDWANRTYEVGEGSFTVVNGEAAFAFDEDGNEVAGDYQPTDPDAFVERGYFTVQPPVFGDVTGDGVEEALIVSVYNGGGTGQFDGVDAYGLRDGQPVVIGHLPGGDRGDGGLYDIKVEGGAVVVERMMSGPEDGACCPSKLQVERWAWQGGAFVEDEAARTMIDMPKE